MKNCIKSIVAIVLLFCFVKAHSQFVSIVSNKFVVNGSTSCPIYFNGSNNPWEAWNDFGGSYNAATWNQDMINLKTNGINTARIWFSCNGSGQPAISATGVTSAPTAAFWQNCDSLFASAKRNGVYIMATMMSFDHTKTANANSTNWQQMLNSQANVTTYVNNYIVPFINRYKTNPYLWSIDICNEIEWIYENRTGSGDGSNWGAATYPILQRFVAMCAAGIHNNPRTDGTTVLATVGSASVKWNGSLLPNGSANPDGNKWSDANLKAQYNQSNAILDFYSPHYYGWMEQYNSSPFEKTPAQFGMGEKPCMVGEMPAQSPLAADVTGPTSTMTLTTAFNNLLSEGWQGHQPWTANITTNLTQEVGDLATFGSFALAFYNSNKNLVRPTCAITPKCQAPNLGADQSLCGLTGSITLNANITTTTNKVFTWYKGTTVVTGSTGTLTGITTAGTYVVKVDSASGTCVATDTVIISSTIATPTVTGGALCSPATMTLNSGVTGSGLTYQWSLGGTAISGATASTLANVRTPGTYAVSVSATACTSTTASAAITSTNPTPVDGCRATAGTLTLSITNNTGTNYAWYSTATGGTALGSGLSFTTPSVTATTTYYVQNLSSVNTSVGPTTLTGTNSDWGVGTGYQMQFTPLADFSILSFQVPMNIYGAGTISMVVEVLDGSGNAFTPAQTFTGTSGTLASGNNQMVTFTFTNFTILKSWGATLRLRVSSVSAGSPLFTNATASVPYPYTVANVVSITGSVGTSGNMYNYFYNWKISTGSACDRLPVIASINASCGGSCATVAPTVTATVNYCQAATATALTATGTSLLWYTASTGGTGLTTAPIPSTASVGSTIYYVSQTLTGCEGPRAAITVNVTALPTANAGTTVTICTGKSTTLTATGGLSYSWSTAATTAAITVSPTANTTYSVTVSNAAGCTSTSSVLVIVNPVPAAPSVTTPIFYNQNDIASALSATGSNLLWYTVATGGIGSTTAIIPSTTGVGTTSYYVSQTTTSCESQRTAINVIVSVGSNTQTITLQQGWNIISFNVTPSVKTIESVFASVLANLTEVKDADSFWENGQPLAFNRLTQISDGAGYLVNVKAASTLTVSGPATTLPLSLSLISGWNLIGVPSQTASNIATKVGSNPITTVKNFDGFWNTSAVPSITTFDPGKGYFIKATSATTVAY